MGNGLLMKVKRLPDIYAPVKIVSIYGQKFALSQVMAVIGQLIETESFYCEISISKEDIRQFLIDTGLALTGTHSELSIYANPSKKKKIKILYKQLQKISDDK